MCRGPSGKRRDRWPPPDAAVLTVTGCPVVAIDIDQGQHATAFGRLPEGKIRSGPPQRSGDGLRPIPAATGGMSGRVCTAASAVAQLSLLPGLDCGRVGSGSTAPGKQQCFSSMRGNRHDLRSLFSEYGSVDSASVITDRDTGRSRGFGFVELGDSNAGTQAIEKLDGHEWNGRRLTVNEARPREPRR